MLTVKDILNRKAKAFNTIESSRLVIDALHRLNTLNLSYLVVMDGEEFKGIFSEHDYSRNVILKGRKSDTTTVQEVMTTDVPTVSFLNTAEDCMKAMITLKTRYLLAFNDEENFEGVITIHDVLRLVIDNKEKVFEEVSFLLDKKEDIEIF